MFDCPFQSMVALLDVPVFVCLAGLGLSAFESVVAKESLVVARELLGVLDLLDRGAEAIGLMDSGHPAERPESILDPDAQTLEALGEANRAGLPVRIRQNEVVEQVRERLALDGDLELVHRGEV